MKNPNGFGSVIKLSGKRHKPYMARITLGFSPKTGYPIYKAIGYYSDKKSAYNALCNYNINPYDISSRLQLFGNILDQVKQRHFSKLKDNTKIVWEVYYNSLEKYRNLKYINLKTIDFQNILKDKKPVAQNKCKIILNKMDKFALENDIITKGYVEFVDLDTYKPQNIKKIFTTDEIRYLGDISQDNHTARAILIMLYTGMRKGELQTLTSSCIDYDNNIIIHGSKTQAGKNRHIPIHPSILSFLSDNYASYNNNKLKILFPNHTSHECRHTFITRAYECGIDRLVIDKIVGHKSTHVGEETYTHLTDEFLNNQILKFCY